MVRKRSRTMRKTYDSEEEENESDLEAISSPEASPQPKRYGLRQRTKKTSFFEDYDDDYEDKSPNNDTSEDEDDEYQIEEDLKMMVNHKTRKTRLKITPRRKSPAGEAIAVTVSVSSIQPILDPPELDGTMDEGLIDFEDMIRADVVVNKKLDEDALIAKQPATPGAKRGRKLKEKPSGSCPLEVQIDPSHVVRCTNGGPKITKSPKKPRKNTKIKLAPSIVDAIEKFVPPNLDAKEKEVVLSNEYLLGNSFDMTADQFLARKHEIPEDGEEEDETHVPLINFEESDSDDDVVIIEKKPEIIVLDDD